MMNPKNVSKVTTSVMMALCMSAVTLMPLMAVSPAFAKQVIIQKQNTPNPLIIPAGIRIPVKYTDAKKILMTKQETVPLTLEVAAPIKDQFERIIIPAGSQIRGELRPAGKGSRFFAQELIFNEDDRISLNATSTIVTRTETITQGANTQDILTGAAAGAGAATIIAGVTGNKKIEALEVLGGAAVGTLAGWLLPTTGVLGGSRKELLSIDPNQDLTLTVQKQVNL